MTLHCSSSTRLQLRLKPVREMGSRRRRSKRSTKRYSRPIVAALARVKHLACHEGPRSKQRGASYSRHDRRHKYEVLIRLELQLFDHPLVVDDPGTNMNGASVYSRGPVARYLTLCDLAKILCLEAEKWDRHQAAERDELAARIEAFPDLCVGAFCPDSGRLLASLFMKPTSADFWKHCRNWKECADGATPISTASLFGISLSSRSAAGVDAILRFFWPHALAGGWRHIYLGSPIPGWRNWRAKHPGRSIVEYVGRTGSGGLPCDPQLRYYFARGFREVMCIKRNYFPHDASQDHGVILRGTVPLSGLAPVWRAMPTEHTQRITRRLSSLLR